MATARASAASSGLGMVLGRGEVEPFLAFDVYEHGRLQRWPF